MSRYEITVDGVVGPALLSSLEGFDATTVAGRTRLVGEVVDQAALHGIFQRLESRHVDIVEVHRVEA
ncbi:MAG: hypothetical protein WCA30_00090 [Dermatophilaceae bacterium]|jgi:hypothetical protein